MIEHFILKHKQVTKIEDDVYTCDNCGAVASCARQIEHYPSCQRGECKRWAEYYSQPEEDNDEEYEAYLNAND